MITTVSAATRIIYSDVNPDVNVENSNERVFNEDAVNKSIATILGTRKRTRVFNRDFGSYIMDYLMDPLDEQTATSIRLEILDAIRNWEPRITITKTQVIPNYAEQVYYVSIDYTIPALANKSATFTFNLATGN
jgi:phage baseplate assembly protein W